MDKEDTKEGKGRERKVEKRIKESKEMGEKNRGGAGTERRKRKKKRMRKRKREKEKEKERKRERET